MTRDDIPLRKIDHLRFFVGNARQSAYFYRNAFGFDVIAYAGLETRVKHESGYVLQQGNIRFVLVSPLSEQHPESQRLVKHGDGVMDIAIDVEDVQETYRKTTERGESASRRRHYSKTSRASTSSRPSALTATRRTRSSTEIVIAACSPPAIRRSTPSGIRRPPHTRLA